MQMATRVKVFCSQKLIFSTNNPPTFSLTFSPVYSGSDENKQFFAATPGGNFQFFTVNKDAADGFEMGKEYYFDIFAAQ